MYRKEDSHFSAKKSRIYVKTCGKWVTKDVEKIFVQSKLQFDQIILYQIIVAKLQLAQEIFYEIQKGEISFFDAAHLYDIDENRRHLCGCEGKVYRWGLKPDIAVAVFSAKPGEVIRPIET